MLAGSWGRRVRHPGQKPVRTDSGASRAGHPARSPPLEMEFAQRLATLDAVFEAIPEVEFDQTANLRAEAGHDRVLHDAGIDAEPIPELKFDQTLGW